MLVLATTRIVLASRCLYVYILLIVMTWVVAKSEKVVANRFSQKKNSCLDIISDNILNMTLFSLLITTFFFCSITTKKLAFIDGFFLDGF
jgi:hypothetical protein